MPPCLSCGRGFCDECHLEADPCCLSDIQYDHYLANPSSGSGYSKIRKVDADVKDPRSTMRKRAQKILRDTRGIEIGSPCEWKGLADVGGGRHPIVGCREGEVKHIHHGPDKNWFNNDPNNLSGICNFCHNRWHSRNDNCYDPTLLSNPRLATEDELALWNDGKGIPPEHHENCEKQ